MNGESNEQSENMDRRSIIPLPDRLDDGIPLLTDRCCGFCSDCRIEIPAYLQRQID